MAVCMTALLTGMNDNGPSNHSPREAEGETVGVCVCVCQGGTRAQTISTSHPKPPTVVPSTKTRVYINDIHTPMDEAELALRRFNIHIMVVETKEEWSCLAG